MQFPSAFVEYFSLYYKDHTIIFPCILAGKTWIYSEIILITMVKASDTHPKIFGKISPECTKQAKLIFNVT